MTDLQNFVHRGGVLFADSLGNIENTRTGHILTHGYFNDIADLKILIKSHNIPRQKPHPFRTLER